MRAVAATASQAERVSQQPGRNEERQRGGKTGQHASGAGPALLPERPKNKKRRDEEQLAFEHPPDGEQTAAPEPASREGSERGE